MITVKTSVVIECTIEEAFAFRSCFENDSQWWAGIVEARRISKETPGVGAQYRGRFRLPFSPFTMESVFRITEYVPDKCIALVSEGGPMRFRSRYTFEPVSESVTDHARITIEIELPVPKWLRPFKSLMAKFWLRETRRNFRTLKNVIESQVTPHIFNPPAKQTGVNPQSTQRRDILRYPIG